MNLSYKLLIILFCCIITVNQTQAQESSQKENKEKIEIQDNISRANISLQGVYYSFEKKLASFISLYSDVGVGATFGNSSTYGSRWAFSPTIATEGRWYFTYKNRYEKGKKVLFNAADFLSLQAAYIFRPIEKESFVHVDSGYFLFANIGMQRTWGKHINFEFKLGYGIGYIPESNTFGQGVNLKLKFGYIFNRVRSTP